jgi:nucleoside 2-deoxyribosyltransferase
MKKIYWASSLHDKIEQERNRREVAKLRTAGYLVYLPQEHGIWEDMVHEERTKDPFRKEADIIKAVRMKLFIEDRDAIDDCDWLISYIDRSPSEGTLWEMGYAHGLDVPQVIVNACEWDLNLMPEFGAEAMVTSTEEAISFIKKADNHVQIQK